MNEEYELPEKRLRNKLDIFLQMEDGSSLIVEDY